MRHRLPAEWNSERSLKPRPLESRLPLPFSQCLPPDDYYTNNDKDDNDKDKNKNSHNNDDKDDSQSAKDDDAEGKLGVDGGPDNRRASSVAQAV